MKQLIRDRLTLHFGLEKPTHSKWAELRVFPAFLICNSRQRVQPAIKPSGEEHLPEGRAWKHPGTINSSPAPGQQGGSRHRGSVTKPLAAPLLPRFFLPFLLPNLEEERREASIPAQGTETTLLFSRRRRRIAHDDRELQGKRLSARWCTQMNSPAGNQKEDRPLTTAGASRRVCFTYSRESICSPPLT